jgi:hypothetical protein
LFIGTNGLGVQSGLFRTRTGMLSVNTLLDRDQFSVSVQYRQTRTIATAPPGEVLIPGVTAPPVGSTSEAVTTSLSWLHQISEELLMSSTAQYTAGQISTTGHQQVVAASVAIQYTISESLAATMRYTFLDRIASAPGQSFYQNLVLVGISKQF